MAGFFLFTWLTYQRVISPERPDVGDIILQRKKIAPERLRGDIEAFFADRDKRAEKVDAFYRVVSPFGVDKGVIDE